MEIIAEDSRSSVDGLFGVLFDNDGVLVDTEAISDEAFRRALREQGVGLPAEDDVARYCGLTDAAILDDVELRFGAKVDRAAFEARKWELYEELAGALPGGVAVFEGAKELLTELRDASVPVALASSGSRRKVEFNLRAAGLESLFDVVISGEDVTFGKPDPEVFVTAARRLGCPPARCAVFEDSVNGLRAARAAGCVSVGVATTFQREMLLPYADVVVRSLVEFSAERIAGVLNGQRSVR